MIIITFFTIILGLIVRNYNLAKVLFYDWDEGMYAQIAKEIIKNKSLFTTFNGQVWLDKPPLVHGLISLIFSIFGYSEFWTRMIMVITSAILLILLYFLAKKITKSSMASLLSVVTLATSPIFLERTTLLNSDIFIAVSWLGYFLFWDKYWAKLFFLTLGVWSKSVLGFYPLLIEIFYELWQLIFHQKKLHLNLKLISKYLLMITLPSLWYIVGYFKFGQFFIANHFLSQVLKRLYVPIELHFGGKFFYFNYLWEKMGIINLLFVIGYILFGFNILKKIPKYKIKLFDLILFSPLPFLTLLTIMRTKITWYVIIFLPLLCLLIAYLYMKLNQKILKYGLIIFITGYFFLNFIPQTFLLKVNYSPPEKLKLAQCLSKTKYKKIAFLVDEEERKVKNFLEAAHYDTTSSFLYGGSPSFVYYINKKVDYFYSIDSFINETNKYQLLVSSKKDKDMSLQKLEKNSIKICDSENWISIIK